MRSESRVWDDPEARHKAEIDRMRAVIAEITAENLELKKEFEAEVYPVYLRRRRRP